MRLVFKPVVPPPACAQQVFSQFLEGNTLEECYRAVASVANRYLDLLDTQVGLKVSGYWWLEKLRAGQALIG